MRLEDGIRGGGITVIWLEDGVRDGRITVISRGDARTKRWGVSSPMMGKRFGQKWFRNVDAVRWRPVKGVALGDGKESVLKEAFTPVIDASGP